jgi:pilus assembly protein CpaF
MSSDKDGKDSLLDLFSSRPSKKTGNDTDKNSAAGETKVGGSTSGESKSVAKAGNINNQAAPQAKASSKSSTDLPSLKTSQSQQESQFNSNQSQQRTQGGLSPLGMLVMREARQELGNDYGGDQNKKEVEESAIVKAVDAVLAKHQQKLDDIERANIIIHLQKDLLGWGVLQPLIDNRDVTDIHCYDFQTVVLQRGKVSELTGLHWPTHQAYVAFIDRLLMRLGKSFSTQQHTVDASFPNGIRLCVVHESVCGARGPLLCIRVPRISNASLDGIVNYGVAPQLIVDYLASLVRCGLATMMVAGETGTGKTTLIRCLATQFGDNESIIAVEDTPELNFQHPFFRSLVSREANLEGAGEVSLQEHIKTTLRMTPTRVLLGEMRTPFAAEAFLESAQTGHVGMSTIHARSARETLVRLEGLLGRAQKSVAIDIIRQQIALAIDVVVWLIRDKVTGRPRIAEIIEVGNFVEGVIQIRPMFTLTKTGHSPRWRVDSWASDFEHILSADGIHLGEAPSELSLEQGA